MGTCSANCCSVSHSWQICPVSRTSIAFFCGVPNAKKYRNTKEAKIENFTLVLPVMRSLKLKFDSNIAEKVMNEERGAALRLLYQLKMALEKVSAPSLYKMSMTFQASNKKTA